MRQPPERDRHAGDFVDDDLARVGLPKHTLSATDTEKGEEAGGENQQAGPQRIGPNRDEKQEPRCAAGRAGCYRRVPEAADGRDPATPRVFR